MMARGRADVVVSGLKHPTIRRFERMVVLGTVGATVMALGGVLAYVSGFRALGAIRPDYVPMAPSAAASFLLLSVAVFCHVRMRWTGVGRKIMVTLAVLVGVFGLLHFVGNLIGLDLTFESRLTSGAGTLGGIPLARMSPASSPGFVIAALAALLLWLRPSDARLAARFGNGTSSLGILTALLGATVLLAYLFGNPLGYRGATVPMAATTSIAFLFLGAALTAAAGPRSFPVRLMTGESLSARLSRIFLPLVASALIVQGFLSRWVSISGFGSGALLTSVVIVVTGAITAYVVARVSHGFGARVDLSNRMLRESAEQRHTILQTAVDGFCRANADGRLLEVNESFCRMHGYEARELLTMRVSDLEAAETAEQTAAHIAAIIARGETRFETRHRRRDGSAFDVAISVKFLRGDGGQMVAFLQDITERKRAELERDVMHEIAQGVATSANLDELLGLMHRSLKRVVEAENCLVALYDQRTGLFTFPYFVDQHRALPSPLSMSKSCTAYVYRSGNPLLLTPERFGQLKEQHEVELVGSPSPSWMGVPLRTPSAMIGVLVLQHYERENVYDERDLAFLAAVGSQVAVVIERRRAEEAASAFQSQLQQAQKMETVGRLAGGVAHDFNNMLGVILGHADVALMQLDRSQPIHENLTEIRKAAVRSADLTRQLLAYARKQTIMPKVLDLNATVPGVLAMLQRLLGENIELSWSPAPNLWPVSFDESQLNQILTNLCVNARDAIANAGTVRLATANRVIDEEFHATHAYAVPGEYVCLTVADNGEGMSEDVLAHLWEPFFTTKGVGQGTGLGLATVYGIVKQNGGLVTVASSAGQGTTFDIYLPRCVGEIPRAVTSDTVAPLQRGHETILVVEDEPMVLRLTRRALGAQGYTVLGADRPAEAIRLAKEHAGKIDLLLTDVAMPEMSGRDLVQRLAPAGGHLKHLFMSGFSDNGKPGQEPLADGAHFLAKPFSIAALTAKVREVLDGV